MGCEEEEDEGWYSPLLGCDVDPRQENETTGRKETRQSASPVFRVKFAQGPNLCVVFRMFAPFIAIFSARFT